MRRTLAVLWLVVVAFALAALVHVRDPGVVGLAGLAHPRVWPSMVLLTALLAGLEAPALVAHVKGGPRAFAIAAAITAVVLGLGLAAAGASVSSRGEFLTAAAGGALVAALGLCVAVLPASRAFRSAR